MSLLWADSFETYGTLNASITNMLASGWNASSGGLATAVCRVNNLHPRTGTYAMQFQGAVQSNRGNFIKRSIPPTWVGGFAMTTYYELLNWETSLNNGGTMPGIGIMNGDNYIARVFANNDGSFSLSIGHGTSGTGPTNFGTVVYTTAPGLLTQYRMYHLEIKYIIDPTGAANSVIQFRLDGLEVIAVGGLTLPAVQVNAFRTGSISSATGNAVNTQWPAVFVDDVIAWDDAGTVANNWMGPRFQVFTCFPISDGTPNDWVPSTGANTWSMLSKPTLNDTTYAYAVNNGDKSEFPVNIPTGVIDAVKGVLAITRLGMSAAGSADVRNGISVGGVEAYGPNHLLIDPAFTPYVDVYPLAPDGTEWEPTDLGTLRFIIERIS